MKRKKTPRRKEPVLPEPKHLSAARRLSDATDHLMGVLHGFREVGYAVVSGAPPGTLFNDLLAQALAQLPKQQQTGHPNREFSDGTLTFNSTTPRRFRFSVMVSTRNGRSFDMDGPPILERLKIGRPKGATAPAHTPKRTHK